jgi:hypothetical protein
MVNLLETIAVVSYLKLTFMLKCFWRDGQVLYIHQIEFNELVELNLMDIYKFNVIWLYSFKFVGNQNHEKPAFQ